MSAWLAWAMVVVGAGMLASCERPYMVRDCAVAVDDDGYPQAVTWVQPCNREDRAACFRECRPAADRCEADRARVRGAHLAWTKPVPGVSDAQVAAEAFRALSDMATDCAGQEVGL